MDGLFPPNASLDLGPSSVFPPGWLPRRTHLSGRRPTQLRSQCRLLCPSQPGVYVMLDADEKIIYVGKAKDLRKRLLSYFRTGSRLPKAGKIIAQARTLLWEVLPSEFTALLRELELIRRWRPVCNVQGQPLRRRNTFLCLAGSPAPYLYLTRRPPRRRVAIYGPVPLTRKTSQAVRWLNDLFRLRDCPSGPVPLFPDRAGLFPLEVFSPCLRLELGTCAGPCTPEASAGAYRQQVQAARRFLAGSEELLLELTTDMHQAAADQLYERAARLRDQYDHLRWLLERLNLVRQAQKTLSFVYPLRIDDGSTWWYLLHGARVLGCVAAPQERPTAELVKERLATVYVASAGEPHLDAYEPIDGMMLVLSWFRKYPREKRKAIAPAEAATLLEPFLTKPEAKRRKPPHPAEDVA